MADSNCPRCHGAGWICEQHGKPWGEAVEGACPADCAGPGELCVCEMPTCELDIETTGVNVDYDRIVEITLLRDWRPGHPLCACHGTGILVDGNRAPVLCGCATGEVFSRMVNPLMPIPPEAQAIHGIDDAAVAGAPDFADIAAKVQRMVDGAILQTYNGRRFDTVILDRQLIEAGQPGLMKDETGRIVHPEVDGFQFWTVKESRTLESAAERFAGIRLRAGLHSSAIDAALTHNAIEGMRRAFPDLENGGAEPTYAQLIEDSRPADEVDRAGKFKFRDDGVVLFNIGRPGVKGHPATDIGFLRWMLGKDFTAETQEIVRQLIARGTGRL